MFRRNFEVALVERKLCYGALTVAADEEETADEDCDDKEGADESKEAVGGVHGG